MFGFKRKKNVVEDRGLAKEVAPNTKIFYDADLVKKLKNDHRTLLSIFTKIVKLTGNYRFSHIPKVLMEFRTALNAHLLLENVKLYIYLKHCLASDPESSEVMSEMKTEMQGIGKAVSVFIKKYSVDNWTEDMKSFFPGELKKIGAVLTERIENEEQTLYALYLPPDSY